MTGSRRRERRAGVARQLLPFVRCGLFEHGERQGRPHRRSESRLQIHAAHQRVAIELDVDMAELGGDVGEAAQRLHFAQCAAQRFLIGKHRQHHRAVGGDRAGQMLVAAVASGGLGKHDVEPDTARADAGQTFEQLRVQMARPWPAAQLF